MDTLIVLNRRLRRKSQLAPLSSRKFKKAYPVPTPDIDFLRESLRSPAISELDEIPPPKINFVKLYEACLLNANIEEADVSYNGTPKHCNTPQQRSDESTTTCYKFDGAKHKQKHHHQIKYRRIPKVDLVLELDVPK